MNTKPWGLAVLLLPTDAARFPQTSWWSLFRPLVLGPAFLSCLNWTQSSGHSALTCMCGSVLPPPGCGERGHSLCLVPKAHPHVGLPVVTVTSHNRQASHQTLSGHAGREAPLAPSAPSRGSGALGLHPSHCPAVFLIPSSSGHELFTCSIPERRSQPLRGEEGGAPGAQRSAPGSESEAWGHGGGPRGRHGSHSLACGY